MNEPICWMGLIVVVLAVGYVPTMFLTIREIKKTDQLTANITATVGWFFNMPEEDRAEIENCYYLQKITQKALQVKWK